MPSSSPKSSATPPLCESCTDPAAASELAAVTAERDKLLRYYHEIVNELGHDLALREICDLRGQIGALRDQLAMPNHDETLPADSGRLPDAPGAPLVWRREQLPTLREYYSLPPWERWPRMRDHWCSQIIGHRSMAECTIEMAMRDLLDMLHRDQERERGCASAHTMCRIGYLADPTTLDTLLDEFQSQGMPMGSDRWAEHCLTLLRELKAKARTLRKLIETHNEAGKAIEFCGAAFPREQRRRITAEFQERKAREEDEAMKTIKRSNRREPAHKNNE